MSENKSNYWGMAVVLMLVVIAAIQGYIASKQVGPTLTVISSGQVKLPPTQVSMVVTRATIGSSAEEAVTLGDIAMTKIIDSVKRVAGNEVEIDKSFYQVTPQSEGKFLMVSAISVKSANVSGASNLIKYLYANGATTVSNVNFGPADENKASEEAESDAVKNAKIKAENIAKSMGKRLGRIVSVADDNGGMSSSVGDGSYSGSDIKQISLEKKVSVVFEIK